MRDSHKVSDIDYATLASSVYKVNGGVDLEGKISIPKSERTWQILRSLPEDLTQPGSSDETGIRVIAYMNDNNKNIVISVRGSDNVSNAIDDAFLVLGKDPKCLKSVEQFVSSILSDKKYAKQVRKGRVSMTGHSLGAWLAARVAVRFSEADDNVILKATTFENPGILPWLNKSTNDEFLKSILTTYQVNRFGDDESMLSYPNCYNYINTAFKQAGKVFSIRTNNGAEKLRIDTLRSNAVRSLVEMVTSVFYGGSELPLNINKLYAKVLEVHSLHSMVNILDSISSHQYDPRDETDTWATLAIDDALRDFCLSVDMSVDDTSTAPAACAETVLDIADKEEIKVSDTAPESVKLPMSLHCLFTKRSISNQYKCEANKEDDNEISKTIPDDEIIRTEDQSIISQKFKEVEQAIATAEQNEKMIKGQALRVLGYVVANTDTDNTQVYRTNGQLFELGADDIDIVSCEYKSVAESLMDKSDNTTNRGLNTGGDVNICKIQTEIGAEYSQEHEVADNEGTTVLEITQKQLLSCMIKLRTEQLKKKVKDKESLTHSESTIKYASECVVERGYTLKLYVDEKLHRMINKKEFSTNLGVDFIPKIFSSYLSWNSSSVSTDGVEYVRAELVLIGTDVSSSAPEVFKFTKSNYESELTKLMKKLKLDMLKLPGKVDVKQIPAEHVVNYYHGLSLRQQNILDVAHEILSMRHKSATPISASIHSKMVRLEKSMQTLTSDKINDGFEKKVLAIVKELEQEQVLFISEPDSNRSKIDRERMRVSLGGIYNGKALYLACKGDHLIYTHDQQLGYQFFIERAEVLIKENSSDANKKFRIKASDGRYVGYCAADKTAMLVSEGQALKFEFKHSGNSDNKFTLVTKADNTPDSCLLSFRRPKYSVEDHVESSHNLTVQDRTVRFMTSSVFSPEKNCYIDVYQDMLLPIKTGNIYLYKYWIESLTDNVYDIKLQQCGSDKSSQIPRISEHDKVAVKNYFKNVLPDILLAKDKKLVVVMGKQAVGKSSLIHLLLGNEFKPKDPSDVRKGYTPIPCNAHGPETSSDSRGTHTKYPNAFGVKGENRAYLDTPGYTERQKVDQNNSKIVNEQHYNGFNLNVAMTICDSVESIVILIKRSSLTDGRFEDIKSIACDVASAIDLQMMKRTGAKPIFVIRDDNGAVDPKSGGLLDDIGGCIRLHKDDIAAFENDLYEHELNDDCMIDVESVSQDIEKTQRVIDLLGFIESDNLLVWSYINDESLKFNLLGKVDEIGQIPRACLNTASKSKMFVEKINNYLKPNVKLGKQLYKERNRLSIHCERYEQERRAINNDDCSSYNILKSRVKGLSAKSKSLEQAQAAVNGLYEIDKVDILRVESMQPAKLFSLREDAMKKTQFMRSAHVEQLIAASNGGQHFTCELYAEVKTYPVSPNCAKPVTQYIYRNGLVNKDLLYYEDDLNELRNNSHYFSKSQCDTLGRQVRIKLDRWQDVEFTFFFSNGSVDDYYETHDGDFKERLGNRLKVAFKRFDYESDPNRENGHLKAPRVFNNLPQKREGIGEYIKDLINYIGELALVVEDIWTAITGVNKQELPEDEKEIRTNISNRAQEIKILVSEAGKDISIVYDYLKLASRGINIDSAVMLKTYQALKSLRTQLNATYDHNNRQTIHSALSGLDEYMSRLKKKMTLAREMSKNFSLTTKRRITSEELAFINDLYQSELSAKTQEIKQYEAAFLDIYKDVISLYNAVEKHGQQAEKRYNVGELLVGDFVSIVRNLYGDSLPSVSDRPHIYSEQRKVSSQDPPLSWGFANDDQFDEIEEYLSKLMNLGCKLSMSDYKRGRSIIKIDMSRVSEASSTSRQKKSASKKSCHLRVPILSSHVNNNKVKCIKLLKKLIEELNSFKAHRREGDEFFVVPRSEAMVQIISNINSAANTNNYREVCIVGIKDNQHSLFETCKKVTEAALQDKFEESEGRFECIIQ